MSAKPPPAQYTAKSFNLGKPPPKWYARTKGCCLYSARPPQHESIKRIEQKAFSRDHLRIVNFFEDSLTESKLQQLKSTGLQVSATNPRDLGKDYTSRLKGIFSAAKGGVVTIVGHVEGKDTFVAQDAEGKELFRLKVQELHDLADQTDVSLILLGCFTGDSVSTNNPNFVGTLTKIRSVDAVERIDRAAGKATNWAQFLELLGDEAMPLIMSKDFLTADQNISSIRGDLSILGRSPSNGGIDLLLGHVWLRFRCGFLDAC